LVAPVELVALGVFVVFLVRTCIPRSISRIRNTRSASSISSLFSISSINSTSNTSTIICIRSISVTCSYLVFQFLCRPGSGGAGRGRRAGGRRTRGVPETGHWKIVQCPFPSDTSSTTSTSRTSSTSSIHSGTSSTSSISSTSTQVVPTVVIRVVPKYQ
jgi:hypothetical protein